MYEILKKEINIIDDEYINYKCDFLDINYFKDFKYFYSLPKTFKDSNILLVLDNFDYSEEMNKKTFIVGNLQEKFKPIFYCKVYENNKKYYKSIDYYLLYDLSFKAYPTKKILIERMLNDSLINIQSKLDNNSYCKLFLNGKYKINLLASFTDVANEILDKLDDNFDQKNEIVIDEIYNNFELKLKDKNLLFEMLFCKI